MRQFIAIFSLIFALPQAGVAQDLVFSPAPTVQCLRDARDLAGREACIGAAANACMDNTPGGYSTYGMGGCLDRELTWWDDELNRIYGPLRQAMRERDREEAEYSDGAAPSIELALRDMQRAWIDFRDRKCEYEASQWGTGTGRGPAFLGCLMVETGRQVLYLGGWGGEN